MLAIRPGPYPYLASRPLPPSDTGLLSVNVRLKPELLGDILIGFEVRAIPTSSKMLSVEELGLCFASPSAFASLNRPSLCFWTADLNELSRPKLEVFVQV